MDNILDLLEVNDSFDTCPKCGGAGIYKITKDGYDYFVDCEECEKRKMSGETKEIMTDDMTLDKYKIPQEYRNKIFYVTNLDRYSDRVDNLKLLEFKKTLSGIYRKIESSGLIKNSYFIHLDDLEVEYNFVFSCIQTALQKGLTAVPYLDTMELDLLYINALYPERHKDLADRVKFSLDSFFTADYCFIKLCELLTKDTSTRSIHILKTILDRRARQGKPTVLLSSKPYNYIKAIDPMFTKELIVPQKTSVGHSKFIYVSMYGGVE